MNKHPPLRAAALSLSLLVAGCGSFAFQDIGIDRPGLNVAEAALKSGSGQIALQVADALLRERPDDAAALAVKADALTLLGVLDEATAIFEGLLAKNPASTRATIGLGRIKLARDPAAAEVLFQRVATRDPKDLTALNNLGIARDLRGRHAEAQAVYRQALAIDPSLASAQVNLALSLAMSGRGAEAILLLKPAASAPDATMKIRHDYAVVLAMSGQRAEAERILARDLAPDQVRQALDGIGGARSPRGSAASDRNEPIRAAARAIPARADTIPPDAVQPLPVKATPRIPISAAPLPDIVLPLPADARETGAPVAQPAGLVAASAIYQRPLSRSIADADAPPVADATQGPVPARPEQARPEQAVPAQAPTSAPVPAAAAATAEAEQPAAVAPHVSAEAGVALAVQFAAAPSEDAAQSYWRDLARHFPVAVRQLAPSLIRVELNGTVFWRLRATGFASTEDARSLCAQMRRGGRDCFLARS